MLRVIAALMMTVLMGCSAPPPPPPAMTAEEREEFRQEILADVDKVETYLQKTRRGINLTEITLGWFVMILLNELSAHDELLHAHIIHGDGTTESYLRHEFRSNPEREIATLSQLAYQGETNIRLAAREALVCLTTIPNPKSTEAEQRQARTELTAALLKLKRHLSLVASAHLPPKPELPGTSN